MHIVVFGANGSIGSRVVTLLLQRGDTVTAFVHHASRLADHPKLTIVTGDIYNAADVDRAIAGVDIVISALGSWGTKNQDVLTVGMRHIIPAMEKARVARIISLTGSGVLLPSDKLSWYDYLNPFLIKFVAPKILQDGEAHLHLLEASHLDWTVVRSPVMKNGQAKGYRFQNRPPLLWQRICRDDVAKALVDLADPSTETHVKSAPFIVGV